MTTTDAAHLWQEPHHDGSAWCVASVAPRLGEAVEVRVLVPPAPDGTPGATEVSVRVVHDGEPLIRPLRPDTLLLPSPGGAAPAASANAGTWWSCDVVVTNPVTNYRFLLTGPPGSPVGSYAWLNGTGVHRREVTDAADFRLVAHPAVPDWVADAVVYQVFPDRFARSAAADERPLPDWALPAAWDDPVEHTGPNTPFQFYGGDLAGVEEHLDHVVALGATVLYLTPFYPSRSNHRYDASTFDDVDPLLGGEPALKSLLDAAHARGLRVMGDLTTNHTGDGHEWFVRAELAPRSVEAGFYFFETAAAIPCPDGRSRPGYACWLGVPSLPKLDHSSPELRARFYDGPESVVARWLDVGLDAWRIDVANMTGRYRDQDLNHEVARTLVATARAADPETWVLAEHGHDATTDLLGDGWHGAMDYAGFTRPLWTWLSDGESHGRSFFGQPASNPRVDGDQVVAAVREVQAAKPWRAQTASTLHLDSHDTGRFRTAVGGGGSGWVSTAGRDRHLVGVGLQFTMPGVPSVFAGAEIGLTGCDGEHSRTPFPWHRRDEWDEPTLDAFRGWADLRHELVALRRGGLRWLSAGPDWMTFLRGHRDGSVLVHAARTDHRAVDLPLGVLGVENGADMVAVGPSAGDAAGAVVAEVLRIAPDRPGTWAWTLPAS